MEMHLKYPKKRGFFSWEELRCLARALGFQADIFRNNLPEDLTVKDGGISLKNLCHVIDFFKHLNAPLDRTFNIHTDEWNLHVLKKVLFLLDTCVFSLSEIQSIRMAYQVYESPDTKGLLLDEWTLLRALKMCGRTMSPLKMIHRIKHMRNSFEEPGRIQLHEFFDLLLWCEMYEGVDLTAKELDTSKDERNMYKLEEFEVVLSHHDERLGARLNQLYLQEEWHFTKEKHSSKKMPKDIPPVDAEIRKRQVRHHKEKYKHLQDQVSKAEQRLYQAKAGYIRPRPLSAPELNTFEPGIEWSDSSWSEDERPHTVYELTRHLYAPRGPPPANTDIQVEVPRPKVSEYVRPKTSPAVTEENVLHMRHAVQSLKFQVETIDNKYEKLFHDDQDLLLPGYQQRMANRVPQAPPPDLRQPRRKEPANPQIQASTRLSSLHRSTSSVTHDRNCDARYRGWFVTKARRGPHFVLTQPTYDQSSRGHLFQKMYQHSRSQGGGTGHAYRYTGKKDINPIASRVWQSGALGPVSSVDPTGNPQGTPSEGHSRSYHDGNSRSDQEGMLNSTQESLESRGLNSTRESMDSRVTCSDHVSELTTDTNRSKDSPDRRSDESYSSSPEKKNKQRGEKSKKTLDDLTSVPEEKVLEEPRNKDKIIAFRKVGRIEVLEEIVEKGEEEEKQATPKLKMQKSKSEVLLVKSQPESSQNMLGVVGVNGESRMSESSTRSGRSYSTVAPPTREVSSLAEQGPHWLSDILHSKEGGRSSNRDDRACRRLARRLGGTAASQFTTMLMTSFG